jgi:hypothetical protein
MGGDKGEGELISKVLSPTRGEGIFYNSKKEAMLLSFSLVSTPFFYLFYHYKKNQFADKKK